MNPVIIILRLVLPVSILKYPLFGGVLSILLDNIDWHTKTLFGIDPIFEYQIIDKILDTYYLSLLAVVALGFKNHLIRNILIALFIYRVIGFMLFEITQVRLFLFVFPNIFENLFFFYLIIKLVASCEPKVRHITAILFVIIAAIPKMMHEYSIHIIQKPLELDIFGFNYIFQGTLHQAIYIVVIALAFGVYYRLNKSNNTL